MKKYILLFIILCLLFIGNTMAEEKDFSLADIPISPNFNVLSPTSDQSYESGGKIKIQTSASNVASYKIYLSFDDTRIEEEFVGENLDLTMEFAPTYHPITVRIVAYAKDDFSGAESEKTIQLLTPKQEIIEKMIALAYANSKDKRYNFAPAEEDHHIGVCKNFVMRLFDTFSKDYVMAEYPDLKLHMPKNRSLVDSKPYQYGLEWRIESAADGSPFEMVEQFKYNRDNSKDENYKSAYALMTKIQKGDFFQMVGDYGGGNGPHSLYFIEDYNAASDTLHWTDSNMFGKRVDGVRWGYMQFDAVKTGEWFANVFNMKDRGATIYRLRDDLIKP